MYDVSFIFGTHRYSSVLDEGEVLELTNLQRTEQRFIQVNTPSGKQIWINLTQVLSIEVIPK